VELFTSEGCSSCPPADAALTWLQTSQPVAGADVIALEEHVDYWNSASWADRFSSAEITARQQAYTERFRLDSPYTPQMVVDGRFEFVGSDRDRAEEAIATAAKAPKAEVQIQTAPAAEGKIGLQVSVERVPTLPSGDTADVLLAITESSLHSSVAGGENAGRQLTHTAVVRTLEKIGVVRANEPFTTMTKVALQKAWKRNALNAVVFVQEHTHRTILGAASLSLTGK
jgi:hypothetical protein